MSNIKEVLQRAIELAAEPRDNFPKLARYLAKVHDDDKTLLRQFIDASGMGKRKVYYLVELGTRLGEVRIPDERLRRIGWTKAQIIAEYMTRANADELLKQAEENTTEALKAIMRGEEPEQKKHVLHLRFSSSERDEVVDAIVRNGGRRSSQGLAGKEAAILKIIRHAAQSKGRK